MCILTLKRSEKKKLYLRSWHRSRFQNVNKKLAELDASILALEEKEDGAGGRGGETRTHLSL